MDQAELHEAQRTGVAKATRRCVLLGAVVLCLPTLLALFARWSWVLDLCTHYRVYYAMLLVPCGLALLLFRGLRTIAVGVLVVGLWNVAWIVPLYVPPDVAAGNSETHRLRFLLANVRVTNRRYDLVKALIAREQPDVVLLEEVNAAWLAALEDTLDDYPHRVERPLDSTFGMALYSRLPLDMHRVRQFGKAGVPSIVARVTIDGRQLTIVGTHPRPPMSEAKAAARNEQLRDVARYLQHLDGHRIVLGDLNSTSWSPHFADFLSVSGLMDSRRGFGIQPTWMALRGAIRLPIDHALVSPEISVTDRRVGPDIGSDHRPVIVDVAL